MAESCEHCGGKVPLERFQSVIKERDEARQAAEQAGQSASKAEELAAQLENARAELAQSREKWTTERAMLAAGITDPELQEVVAFRYSKTPEDSRPEFGAWLESQASEDKVLASLLKSPAPPAEKPAAPEVPDAKTPPPAAEPAPQAEPEKPAPKPAPNANAGTVPDGPPAAHMSREAYYRQLEAALDKGDTARARQIVEQYQNA